MKVNQIVCLEHQGNCLYGEVIQLIPERQLCWFRPFCLAIFTESPLASELNKIKRSPDESQLDPLPEEALIISENTDEFKIINLQSGSDLLWPDCLFRPAIDQEIIDFLPYLSQNSHQQKVNKVSKKYLNKFVHLVWQAHKDKF